MAAFDDIQDLEDWLDGLDYLAIWDALAPFSVFSLEDRDHCDRLIAGGKVKQATILEGLRAMAFVALRDRFDLQHRRYNTHARQGLASVH